MNHYQQRVVLQGHIIDSLLLPKVLDLILMMGRTFDLEDVHIGKTREEPSRARIVIRAASTALLDDILKAIQPHGTSVEREANCQTQPAPATVPPVYVDVNLLAPTNLPDRGSFQAVGLVMDAASFLTEVARALGRTI